MAKSFSLSNERATQLLADIRQVSAQSGDWQQKLKDLEETFEYYVEYTADPERVIFRKFPHNGEVIALFPDQLNERTGDINSYLHNGQHAETAPDFGDTVAADPNEYSDLKFELERQGYFNLRVVKRFGKLGRK